MLDVRNYPFISNVDRNELLKKNSRRKFKNGNYSRWKKRVEKHDQRRKNESKRKKNGKRGTEETGKLRGPSRIFTSHSRNGSR